MGSITATTKNGIPVKIVFIKHRTNRRKVLCLLSTDLSLENIVHTSIVFSRYMLFTWRQRKNVDDRTFGETSYYFCDEINDINYSEAIASLVEKLMTAADSSIVNFIGYLKSQ